MTLLAKVQIYPCWRCGAAPGQVCVDAHGRTLIRYHVGGQRSQGRSAQPVPNFWQDVKTGIEHRIEPPPPWEYPQEKAQLRLVLLEPGHSRVKRF